MQGNRNSAEDVIAPRCLIAPEISGANLSTTGANGMLYLSGAKLCVYISGVGYAVH